MDIIAVNGQEISLGCFVNLPKTACVPNGIFAKINKYYDSITHDLNALQLVSFGYYYSYYDLLPVNNIELYYNNVSYLDNLLTDCHEIYTPILKQICEPKLTSKFTRNFM